LRIRSTVGYSPSKRDDAVELVQRKDKPLSRLKKQLSGNACRRLRRKAKPTVSENATERLDLPAGGFSAWLRRARSALLIENGIHVGCGECTACCSSSYFIHIQPEETRTLDRIRKDLLAAAPGRPKGHVLLGYDGKGFCPMLKNGKCSIYEHRPLTCRNYDCRIFTAAGIAAGDGDKVRINRRVARWRFSYPAKRDRDEHLAVRAASKFIREHAKAFPAAKTPDNPSQLAVLAIKVYDVFLKKDIQSIKTTSASSDAEIADAIIKACAKFDSERQVRIAAGHRRRRRVLAEAGLEKQLSRAIQ
jgi:uncharacterized protein